MLKKIIFIFIFSVLLFWFFEFSYWAWCNLWANIWDSIESCIWDSSVLQPWDLKVTGWFKSLIVDFINKVSTILAIVAVWSIAYGSMVIVSSFWNDEKIKKWRNIIKWALIWFLVLVSAAWIIKLIIYIIYWL